MLTSIRHLRIVHVVGIVTVLVCFHVASEVHSTSAEIIPFQWALIAMMVWAAGSGFLLERAILVHRKPRVPRFAPIVRWRWAHLSRISTAVSVACWGVIFRETGGPAFIAYIAFALSLMLLLIWQPTPPPAGESPIE